jgi:hypothetical protein
MRPLQSSGLSNEGREMQIALLKKKQKQKQKPFQNVTQDH